MNAIIDWIAARAVVFGALAIIFYMLTPPKQTKKGIKHGKKTGYCALPGNHQ